MWLFDSGLNQLNYDDDGGTGYFSSIVRGCLSPGTYYVKVDEYGNNDQISAYSITLTIASPCASGVIYGRITQDGAVAAGIVLDLQYYHGDAWSTMINTTTDSSGNYQFNNVPNLKSGEKYNVAYSNPERNDTRLWRRQSFALTSFTGGTVFGGDFDIQNIYHQSPGPGASVTLPATFCWTRRNVANDNYFFVLQDPAGWLGWVWYDAGSNTCYTLTSLPSGYQFGVSYGWSIGVKNNPVDSYDWGVSYYYRPVTFQRSAQTGLLGGDMWVPAPGDSRSGFSSRLNTGQPSAVVPSGPQKEER